MIPKFSVIFNIFTTIGEYKEYLTAFQTIIYNEYVRLGFSSIAVAVRGCLGEKNISTEEEQKKKNTWIFKANVDQSGTQHN